ncbi:hypothetical protein HDV00_003631 [Rhizophlyctis rosea]|nr:hypothetical protein HDV00_003631 [Rhizophlyctis rosea]
MPTGHGLAFYLRENKFDVAVYDENGVEIPEPQKGNEKEKKNKKKKRGATVIYFVNSLGMRSILKKLECNDAGHVIIFDPISTVAGPKGGQVTSFCPSRRLDDNTSTLVQSVMPRCLRNAFDKMQKTSQKALEDVERIKEEEKQKLSKLRARTEADKAVALQHNERFYFDYVESKFRRTVHDTKPGADLSTAAVINIVARAEDALSKVELEKTQLRKQYEKDTEQLKKDLSDKNRELDALYQVNSEERAGSVARQEHQKEKFRADELAKENQELKRQLESLNADRIQVSSTVCVETLKGDKGEGVTLWVEGVYSSTRECLAGTSIMGSHRSCIPIHPCKASCPAGTRRGMGKQQGMMLVAGGGGGVGLSVPAGSGLGIGVGLDVGFGLGVGVGVGSAAQNVAGDGVEGMGGSALGDGGGGGGGMIVDGFGGGDDGGVEGMEVDPAPSLPITTSVGGPSPGGGSGNAGTLIAAVPVANVMSGLRKSKAGVSGGVGGSGGGGGSSG